jgi:hypothetical protein
MNIALSIVRKSAELLAGCGGTGLQFEGLPRDAGPAEIALAKRAMEKHLRSMGTPKRDAKRLVSERFGV